MAVETQIRNKIKEITAQIWFMSRPHVHMLLFIWRTAVGKLENDELMF